MLKIRDEILPNIKYYPDKENIFRVFKKPINSIKVVILGQDPYSRGEAIGLSFAVDKKTTIPPSLKIIKNEIRESRVEIDSSVFETDLWKELSHWRNQGVFLLNSALTVEKYNPGSHTMLWQWFTRELVNTISLIARPVWMLWGAKAKGYENSISSAYHINSNKASTNIQDLNYILLADHPAAETYLGSKYKFTGCNHFNICNQILKLKGQTIINW